MKLLKPKNLLKIGYILVPIGIVGYAIIVPPLLTPRNPSEHFWFFYSLRTFIALIFACGAILGILSLVMSGILTIKNIIEKNKKL